MDAVHDTGGSHVTGMSRRRVLQGVGAGLGLAMVGTGPALATPATLAKHYDPAVLHGWIGALYRSQAQAFAWLAVRSIKGLPLSLPSTTGVPEPMTGGRLAKAV